MNATELLNSLEHLNAEQLRRLLVEHLTQKKLGLYWEANAIARDAAHGITANCYGLLEALERGQGGRA
jgi:hypothetical protein